MSALDKQLSDSELNRFLRQALLEREDDALLTQFSDMEATFIFAAEPLVIPGMQQEQLLIKKLGAKFGIKPWMKWMWPGAGTAGVAGIAIAVATLMNPAPESNPAQTAAAIKTETRAPKTPEEVAILAVSEIQDDSTAITPIEAIPENLPLLPLINHGPLQAIMPLRMMIPVEPVRHTAPQAYPCRRTDEEGNQTVDTVFNNVKRLVVNGLYSDISVKAGTENSVSLKGNISVETKGIVTGKPDYKIHYKQEGELLTVWIENAVKRGNIMVAGKLQINSELNFVVPAGIAVKLENSSGDIFVEGLNGPPVEASTIYGDITAGSISTDIHLMTQSGDITLAKLTGNATIASTYGDQEIRFVTGNVTCENASGDITLQSISGNVKISSTYGDVKLTEQAGNSVSISVASGKVMLNGITAKKCQVSSTYGDIAGLKVNADLDIEASSGDIRLMEINGNISCSSAYGDHVYSGVKGNISINSASGNMNLVNIAGNANVNSTYGNLTLEEFKGDLEANVISGNIKGTRVTLVSGLNLSASSGDIKMNLLNPMDDLSFDLNCDSGSIKVEKDGQKFTGKDHQLTVKKGPVLVKTNSVSGNQSFF